MEEKMPLKKIFEIMGSDRVYKIIGLDRKTAGTAGALVKKAAAAGFRWIKLELCGEGKWTDKELAALKKGLKEAELLVMKSVLTRQRLYLVNFLDFLGDEGEEPKCELFAAMLVADGEDNYVFAPPYWRFSGKGVKIGKVGRSLKGHYQSCVYEEGSRQCVDCLRRNFAELDKFYDGKAGGEFVRWAKTAVQSLKYLAAAKPGFKDYLGELARQKHKESALFSS